MLINVVGILTFMSRIDFMLSCVEYEISFITSGPDLVPYCSQYSLSKNISKQVEQTTKVMTGRLRINLNKSILLPDELFV